MKQVGYYHIFPFHKVERNQPVILWGMGEVGRHYLKQLWNTGYCPVEFVVDQNWKNFHKEDIQVDSPSRIQGTVGYPIVIANGNEKVAKSIRQQLMNWGVEERRIIWNDVIIGEEMVVDEGIADIRPDNSVKRIGYYHVFPFQTVKKDEQIVLWGMGEVGRHYLAQLKALGYGQVLYGVDKDWKHVKEASIPIHSPQKLQNLENARVVIANGNQESARAIQEQLSEMGIPEKCVVWQDMIVSEKLVVNEIIGRSGGKRVPAPYLAGSESGLSRRTPVARFATRFLDFDVISFDIFDTSIFRPFTRPTDLFYILAEKHNYMKFRIIRINAEKKAREISRLMRHSLEVTLEDIYRIIEQETGLDAEKGCRIEFETELELCFANPYMLEVYRVLKSQGKRIIFTSNMYLNRNYMLRLLQKCGYEDIQAEDIFVSCDYSVSKGGGGGLYRLEKNKFGKHLRYAHVGDNWNIDVLNARKNGFTAFYYRNVNDIGNSYRATYSGMSELVGSAYGGIVNAHLHNGIQQYDIPYEFGYIYGGIYILGYAQWIQDYAEMHHVEKVLFLARDGDILQQVFNMIPEHVPSSYALWSRMAAARLTVYADRHFFLNRLVRDPIILSAGMQVYDWLELVHLQSLHSIIQQYPLALEQVLDGESVGILETFIQEHWDEILKCYEEEGHAARVYFQSLIGNAKSVAVVDIGWTGNCVLALKRLIEEKWSLGVQVHCLLSGFAAGEEIALSNEQSGRIKAYMFSPSYNRDLYRFHRGNFGLKNLFFEFLSQSATPTFSGFSLDKGCLKLDYGFPEIENYYSIRRIQEGIRDFARTYLQCFSSLPWMYRISGWNAYQPGRLLASYPLYFRKHFKDQVFIGGLATNIREAKIESIGEIMKRCGC